jgi:hypothetical protein
VDRPMRRRGQLLVVTGALLGALAGGALGLVVEDAQQRAGLAAQEAEAAPAAPGQPGGRSSGPRTAQPPQPAAQPSERRGNGHDQRHGKAKAGRASEHARASRGDHGGDKPAKDKPAKDKPKHEHK